MWDKATDCIFCGLNQEMAARIFWSPHFVRGIWQVMQNGVSGRWFWGLLVWGQGRRPQKRLGRHGEIREFLWPLGKLGILTLWRDAGPFGEQETVKSSGSLQNQGEVCARIKADPKKEIGYFLGRSDELAFSNLWHHWLGLRGSSRFLILIFMFFFLLFFLLSVFDSL